MYGNNNPFGDTGGQRNSNPNKYSPLQRHAEMTQQQQQMARPLLRLTGPGPDEQRQQQEVFGSNFGTSSLSFGSPNPFNMNAGRFHRPGMNFESNPTGPRFARAFATPPSTRYAFNAASSRGNTTGSSLVMTSSPAIQHSSFQFIGGAASTANPPPNDNPPSYESAMAPQAKVYETRFRSNAPSGNVFRTTSQASDDRSRYSYVANRRSEETRPCSADPRKKPSNGRRNRSDNAKDDRLEESSSKKPVLRRTVESGSIFARAVAGVAAPTSSSKEEKPKTTSHRRSSERRSSGSDAPRLSPEEIERMTSIVVRGIPSTINHKRFLIQHFGKYGIITRISCLPKKEMAIIRFSDHAGAENAKTNGANLQSGKPAVLIFWGKMVAGNTRFGSSKPEDGGVDSRRDISPQSPSREKKVSNDEVEAELQAMGQTDITNAPRILERPKNVAVRSVVLKPVKQRTGSQVPTQMSDSGNDPSLAFLNGQSLTSAEKFQTLVARDKLLRQKLKKPSDLANAKAVIGTCPDMCPEKERYMREERGQLHPYEVATGNEKTGDNPTVNHKRAVKEYSRSSADQEEPLPHELRPPHVLARTMDYIICNVLDLLETSKGSSSAAEWYDFVWNRTRAIRKDITQEHLCDVTSVAMVEKCARFHIHCAERLCEEDMSTFDQKINNENLTKCLQTLKYFYADLELKGECCPNEAEFRAYDILLNLNEGDTIREAQCFRLEIRQCIQVQFALSAFLAINSNNYVAFFRLVRRASYLEACILQRYFTQVRMRAMKVLLKAYCPPNRSGQFPMATFTEMLGFEDMAETQEFLDYHGILVEFGQIVLDKAGFIEPDNPVPVRRARILIESKRICSVGEIVNGGSLPPNPFHTYDVHYSFDAQGFFVKDVSTDHRDTAGHSKRELLTSTEERREPDDNKEDSFIQVQLGKVVEGVAMEIVAEVVTTEVRKVGRFVTSFLRLFKVTATELATSLLLSVSSEMLRDTAINSLNESKAEVLRARKQKEEAEQERRQHVKRVADEHVASRIQIFLDEVVRDEIRELSAEVFESELVNERNLCVLRCTDGISSEYAADWTDSLIADICLQVYSEEKELRRKILARVSQTISDWRAGVFFRKWQNIMAKRRRLKRTMEAFPSTNLCGNSKSFTEPWIGSRTIGLMSPIQIANNQQQVNSLLDIGVHCCHLTKSMRSQPLDVLQIFKNNASGRNAYWKVAVLMPAKARTDLEYARLLKEKLTDNVSRSSSLSVELLNMQTCRIGNNVIGVCIKAFYECFEPRSELVGTRGIVMLLQTPQFKANQAIMESYWNSQYDRLAGMLRNKPSWPPLPILVLCPWHSRKEDVEAGLRLPNLAADELISKSSILEVDREAKEPSFTVQLSNGIEWLSQNCPQPPDLVVEDLRTFVDNFISKCFSPAAYRAIRRSNESPLHMHPTMYRLIKEYNQIINQAAGIVSSQHLIDVSWPPAEFSRACDSRLPDIGWNSKERLLNISKSVSRCRLPVFFGNATHYKTFEQLENLIWDYIDLLIQYAPQDAGSKIVLASRTQKILDHTHNNLQHYDATTLTLSNFIPWTNLIHVFIHHVLQTSDLVQHTVAYDPNVITVSREWETAIGHTVPSPPHVTATVVSASVNTLGQKSHQQEPSLKRKLAEDPFAEQPRERELKRNYSELSRQLGIEKQRNAEYEDYLMKLAGEGNQLGF